jgi:hypothetical protein
MILEMEENIMKWVFASIVGVVLTLAGTSTANAQWVGGYGYSNPWTGGSVYRGGYYSPWGGGYYGAYGYNPWGGRYYGGGAFANPWTGTYGSSRSWYNPWSGRYGYRYRVW